MLFRVAVRVPRVGVLVFCNTAGVVTVVVTGGVPLVVVVVTVPPYVPETVKNPPLLTTLTPETPGPGVKDTLEAFEGTLML
jgi:hypothetical protein